MKTPQQKPDKEQRSSNSTAADRLVKKKTKKTKSVSFPPEILESILSRLPAKSILRSQSVSKPWLSLLTHPSFTKLHFTLATSTHRRTAFFISAFDRSTRQCQYLTSSNVAGPLTKLITIEDYEKRVWVKETIKFPKCWNDLVGRVPPTVDGNMDGEIVFCLGKRTENVITIPVYNMKSKCFKTVEFALDDQFASPKSVSFRHICCYVETIMPLDDNWSKTSD